MDQLNAKFIFNHEVTDKMEIGDNYEFIDGSNMKLEEISNNKATFCLNFADLPSHCFDGTLSDEESDIDCGGLCASACGNGQFCNSEKDCKENLACSNGICTDNGWLDCSDSDGGKNIYIKGTQSSSTSSLTGKNEDFCLPIENKKGLREYYCEGNSPSYEDLFCENSCQNGACIKSETENCKDSDNSKAFVLSEADKTIVHSSKEDVYAAGWTINQDGEIKSDYCVQDDPNKKYLKESVCVDGIAADYVIFECPNGCKDDACNKCDGCLDGSKCLPYGLRIENKYCDFDSSFKEQKLEEQTCNNNYECSTNFCVDSKCVSSSIIQKLIEWFKNLFGD